MTFALTFFLFVTGVLAVGFSIGFCIGHAVSTRYWKNAILNRRAAFALRQ